MPRFLSPLRVELAGYRDGRPVWRLLEPLVYETALLGEPPMYITADAGFETDCASVPRLPLAYLLAGDTAHAPAVIHDVLYRSNGVTRAEADRIFAEAMAVDQPGLGIRAVPRWRRVLMWSAVRLGGRGTWSRYRGEPDTVSVEYRDLEPGEAP